MVFQKIEVYPILDIEFLKRHRKNLENEIRILKDFPVNMLQVRWKKGSTLDFYRTASRVRELWDRTLIINDRVDVALAVKGEGVHIGEDDLPANIVRNLMGKKAIIGLSTHSIKEIKNSENLPLTYIAFGSIFPTTTKGRDVKVQGIQRLKKAVEISVHPVFAIGGINCTNISEVLETGVKGVAMISGIFGGNTERNLKSIFKEIERWTTSC